MNVSLGFVFPDGVAPSATAIVLLLLLAFNLLRLPRFAGAAQGSAGRLLDRLIRYRRHAARHKAAAMPGAARLAPVMIAGLGLILLWVHARDRMPVRPPADAEWAAIADRLGVEGPLDSQAVTRPDGTRVTYLVERDASDRITGYVFSSEQLAPAVQGFGGPLVLAIATDADGTLRAYDLLRHQETPAYLARLDGWRSRLIGRNCFEAGGLAGIEAVTGATVSSQAILEALGRAGLAMVAAIGREDTPTAAPAAVRTSRRPNAAVPGLIVLAVAALALRQRPGRKRRVALLAIIVLVPGIAWNVQYSTLNGFGPLTGRWPPPGLSVAALLTLGLPLLVLLTGNLYCGWLCPFGALQELAGNLLPRRWRRPPDAAGWGRIRIVKYAVLGGLMLAVLWHQTLAPLDADPLITAFEDPRSGMPALALAVLGLGLVFPRLWCRAVCPAGALLSLLNVTQWWRRLAPPVNHRRCPFGVQDVSEPDCLCCDRCRGSDARPAPDGSGRAWRIAAIVAAATLAAWLLVKAWHTAAEGRNGGGELSRAVPSRTTGGQRGLGPQVRGQKSEVRGQVGDSMTS